jgi:hypothetical protein
VKAGLQEEMEQSLFALMLLLEVWIFPMYKTCYIINVLSMQKSIFIDVVEQPVSEEKVKFSHCWHQKMKNLSELFVK